LASQAQEEHIWASLAESYKAIGQYEEAINYWKKYQKTDTDHYAFSIGYTLMMLGKYQEAYRYLLAVFKYRKSMFKNEWNGDEEHFFSLLVNTIPL
jgi:tetratricopeptide (TPR) repeat protein